MGQSGECASAIQRLGRDGTLSPDDLSVALERLDLLTRGWVEVEPREQVRRRAMRPLRVHTFRAAAALQPAAALAACREDPGSLPIVCGNGRLREAARTEGFSVL